MSPRSAAGYLVIGTLNVTNSSITGNTATLTTSGGGGIFCQGILNLSNSTIHGNRAGNGAGILLFFNSTTMTITTTTITGNTAFDPAAFGGGVLVLAATRPYITPSSRKTDLIPGSRWTARISKARSIHWVST